MSIKVMVLDSSALMRKILSHILRDIEGVEVFKTVSTETELFTELRKELPDLITIDIQDSSSVGLNLLSKLTHLYNVPVLLICSSTDGKETTLKALELGALDFISRPKDINKDWTLFSEALEKKIKAHFSVIKPAVKQVEQPIKVQQTFASPVDAIVIGASTGGPKAIIEVIKELPEKVGIPIFIVQHMPKGFTASFAKRLNTLSALKIVEAEDGERIYNDIVYLAPGGKHMVIENNKIRLTEDEKIHGVRPAVDYLFESAAEKYQNHLVGVVLTGMGNDGLKGSMAIKKAGGYIITQDQETCVIYGMPRNVEEKGFSDKVARLDEIGGILKHMIG